MSTTFTANGAAAAAPAPALTASVPVRAALPRRRRPGLAAAGLGRVVLGFLGAYAYAKAASTTRPYLALAHTVTAGARITDADLRVVEINAATGLEAVAAGQRSTVVGKYAKVELVVGSLLASGQLTDTAVPGPNEQLIGLQLKPAQLPSRPLSPGEPVLLVIISDPRNVTIDPKAAQSATTPNPPTVNATVYGVGKPATDGQVVVDVIVAASDGPGLVERASQGRVAIALRPKG